MGMVPERARDGGGTDGGHFFDRWNDAIVFHSTGLFEHVASMRFRAAMGPYDGGDEVVSLLETCVPHPPGLPSARAGRGLTLAPFSARMRQVQLRPPDRERGQGRALQEGQGARGGDVAGGGRRVLGPVRDVRVSPAEDLRRRAAWPLRK